jgi:hypothetical protein
VKKASEKDVKNDRTPEAQRNPAELGFAIASPRTIGAHFAHV